MSPYQIISIDKICHQSQIISIDKICHQSQIINRQNMS